MTKRQRRAKFANALAIFAEMGKERTRVLKARRPAKISPESVPRYRVVTYKNKQRLRPVGVTM